MPLKAKQLRVSSRRELTQAAGFVHAGVLGALVDVACGFAAGSVAGPVFVSQYQVLCYKPAIGDVFVARAKVDRAGKRQLFASAQILVVAGGSEEVLVAGGSAVLIRASY